jgi:hypothetical protein
VRPFCIATVQAGFRLRRRICPLLVQSSLHLRTKSLSLRSLLALVQMPVSAQEQRAAVRVSKTLSSRRGIHPERRHQRAGRVPQQMEREAGKAFVALRGESDRRHGVTTAEEPPRPAWTLESSPGPASGSVPWRTFRLGDLIPLQPA